MSECNRVDPYGEIVSIPLRGQWMGNRGSIHRNHHIIRPWSTKRWIICTLDHKGWVAPKWIPGRWTPLFFYDEALALAAGHRPCALCRRAAYNRYQSACGITGADAMDAQLDAQRRDGRQKRMHEMNWRDVPCGAYVLVAGTPHVTLHDGLRPWTALHGYGRPVARPGRGRATVLTPPLSVRAISRGFEPQIASNESV